MQKRSVSQYELMTRTPIPRLVVSLAIPTTISMLITNIYNMADTAFVGRLGTSATGGVGVVFGFMAILQAVAFMFGQGCGSIASRSLGAKNREEADRVASTGFFCTFGIGCLFLAGGLAFIHPLVRMLGSTETIAPYAEKYVFWILLSAPFIMCSFFMNNVLRYEGKAALGMTGMMTGALLNIAMDPVLMFACGLGISGAGMATALSQVISFFILLYMFLSGRTTCRLRLSCASLRADRLFDICTTGLPSLLRQTLNSLTTVLLNLFAGGYGDAAVAAMSIVSRLNFFIFAVSLGIGQGYQPVSGFNYGAGKYSRLREGYRFTLMLAEGLLCILNVIALAFSGALIGLFRDDPEVILIGTRALRLQCLALFFLPMTSITEMQLQTTGQRLEASILSSLRSGLFFIPLLPILAHFRGLYGIEEAQPIALLLTIFPAVYFIRRFFRSLPPDDRPDPAE